MQPIPSYKGRPETYKCLGRQSHGPEFCRQPQVQRTLVDEALLAQLTSRYFDLDGTRDRLRARLESELPNAETAVIDAERDLARAEANLARVKADYISGDLTASEWRELRADLDESRAAALEAVTQARSRVEQIVASGATTDAEEALLRLLADLKRLVTGTVDQARDVESLRVVIRTLFASLELISPDRPLGHGAPGVIVPKVATARAGTYLLALRLRPEMVNWTEFAPIRQPLPEDVTPSTCR